jgi:Raf kinase inhibitor-like YbhB/YbcL family protein
MAGIELRSSAFSDHDLIPRRYAKDGGNISPPLAWSGVPASARELVLVCEDPDAPSGTFLHWLLTGIDPHSDGVAAGQVPPGAHAEVNGFGDRGWDGPQPPVGDPPHRYFFRLYAVTGPPPLPAEPSAADVRRALAGREQASGTLVGLYQR